MKDLNKLPDAARRKEIKQHDPIWRYMRIERVVNISQDLLILGWTGFYLSTRPRLTFIISSFFSLYMLLQWSVIRHIMNERYWLRIGARRLEVLHNGVSPQILSVRVPAPDAAPLPLVVSLDWNRKSIIITATTVLILLLLVVAGYVLWRSDGDGGFFFGAILDPILFFLLIIILLTLSYHAYFLRQHIEVNEEGITTCYQNQKCRIRWQDARLFAQYSAGGSGGRQTFELSNEQVIVRWSKDAIGGNFLLKPANNFADHNYYDTLITQVNAHVAERSQLPLLHLDIIKPAAKTHQQKK